MVLTGSFAFSSLHDYARLPLRTSSFGGSSDASTCPSFASSAASSPRDSPVPFAPYYLSPSVAVNPYAFSAASTVPMSRIPRESNLYFLISKCAILTGNFVARSRICSSYCQWDDVLPHPLRRSPFGIRHSGWGRGIHRPLIDGAICGRSISATSSRCFCADNCSCIAATCHTLNARLRVQVKCTPTPANSGHVVRSLTVASDVLINRCISPYSIFIPLHHDHPRLPTKRSVPVTATPHRLLPLVRELVHRVLFLSLFLSLGSFAVVQSISIVVVRYHDSHSPATMTELDKLAYIFEQILTSEPNVAPS